MKIPNTEVLRLAASSVDTRILWTLTLLMILGLMQIKEVQAEGLAKHELVGKIWSVKEKEFVDLHQLQKQVLNSEHVIVGETHDNIEHHRIQAQVLRWFIDAGKPVNPVFEMLSDEQLAVAEKTKYETSDKFFDKVAWEESGWPDRKLYKPIFDLVIAHDLSITAAETARDVLMQLMKQGESKLPDDLQTLLSQVKLDEAGIQLMKEEIIDSHCGMLPEKMVEPMILGQRVRDAVMARSTLKAAEKGSTLLIAGSGHGRNDFGVPAYLKAQNPKSKVTSIGMMEVVDEVTDPQDYREAWASETIPFDFVWFTDRMDREDPCEEMRQHFKKHPV